MDVRASEDEGMWVMVNRANLGEELPWSKATKGIAAGGGI
jgi:hypothetical protein